MTGLAVGRCDSSISTAAATYFSAAGANVEIAVSPDGRSIVYCHAPSHMNQDAWLVTLEPPSESHVLPRLAGQPRRITDGKGRWHAHAPAWTPDGTGIVYARDADEGDVYTITHSK